MPKTPNQDQIIENNSEENLNQKIEDEARDQRHAAVVKDVFTGDTESLKEKISSGEVDDLIDRIEKYSTHPATLKSLTEMLETVDQTAAMKRFRNFWNGLSHLAQWGLMHASKGAQIFSGRGPIHTLIKFGFIDYKGHLDENGEIMEEKIISMGGWDKFFLKYGIKFGKYFLPELAAVEPFVGPLLKLDNVADNVLVKARQYLRSLHEITEKPEKNIGNISEATRSQMETFSLLPSEKESADKLSAKKPN